MMFRYYCNDNSFFKAMIYSLILLNQHHTIELGRAETSEARRVFKTKTL